MAEENNSPLFVLSKKFMNYTLVISLIFLSIFILFVTPILIFIFGLQIKYLIYLAVIFIVFIIFDIFYNYYKIKNYYIKFQNQKLIIHKGRIFTTDQIIYLTKVYSIEIKQNIISKKYFLLTINIKTIDNTFDITGLHYDDALHLLKFLEPQVMNS
jgi:membrane protein YdbS with pleckstrin-like domain